MLRTLFETDGGYTALLLRVALGAVMFPHGAQKVLGWFGGHGFQGTLGYMTGTLGIPTALAGLAIVTEFVAPLALVLGLGGRLAALGIAGIMVVAALTVHREHGFFMNWFGNQKGEGFEYHVLAAALAFAIVLVGSGSWSLDQVIAARLGPTTS